MTNKKLKTFKDFKRKQYSEGEDKKRNEIKFFDERELRKEAIKWVKEMEKQQEKFKKVMGMGEKEKLLESHIVTWIKHFFNLTEEDLK